MTDVQKLLKHLKCAFRGHHWTKSRTRNGYVTCARCGKRMPAGHAA